MAAIDRVNDIVAPLVESLDLSIYDIERAGPTLRISVQSTDDEGVGSAALTRLTRMVSSALDEADIISGSYTLEVTSPGLERKLRTVEHFRDALGDDVKLKMQPNVEPRRHQGTLTAVDADAGTVAVHTSVGDIVVAIADISIARTVFEWGPGPKPGGNQNKRSKQKSRGSKQVKGSKQSTTPSRTAQRSAG